jgi:hypothetical protein
MPKVHQIGQHHFLQVIPFPVKWGIKVAVKGWTQEIEYPYREASPLILRLPKHKALVIGRWQGKLTEEEALTKAIGGRELSDEDFQEEKGWTPAPQQGSEEGRDDLDSRPSYME